VYTAIWQKFVLGELILQPRSGCHPRTDPRRFVQIEQNECCRRKKLTAPRLRRARVRDAHAVIDALGPCIDIEDI